MVSKFMVLDLVARARVPDRCGEQNDCQSDENQVPHDQNVATKPMRISVSLFVVAPCDLENSGAVERSWRPSVFTMRFFAGWSSYVRVWLLTDCCPPLMPLSGSWIRSTRAAAACLASKA